MNKLFFNFFEILVSKTEVRVPYIGFETREHISALRNEHPNTVFTHSRDKIYYQSEGATGRLDCDGYQLVSKESDTYLFLNLIRDTFLDVFYKNREQYRIYKNTGGFYEITVFDQELSGNRFSGIELYRTYHLHFAPLFFGGEDHIGFTVSASISPRIVWTKENFESNDIDCDGLETHEESGLVLTKNKALFRLRKQFDYSENYKAVLDQLNAIPDEFEAIRSFVKEYFYDRRNGISLPNDLEVADFKEYHIDRDGQQNTFEAKMLNKPEKYFYEGKYPSFENNFPDREKIKYNKPFTYDDFENREVNLTLICPENVYTDARNFFKHVVDELKETFHLGEQNFRYTPVKIEGIELQDYINVLPTIKATDLVLIVVDETHEALPPNASPYHYCKAKFLERGVNTQEVQIQKMSKLLNDKASNSANYTDHNLALNIYAKLGGMAWTTSPQDENDELIIGIGATTDSEGQPVLGLMNIFKGNGRYLYGKISAVTSMENYCENLEELLTTNIQEYVESGLLDVDKTCRLIFHIFKPAGKDNEIEALLNTINKLYNYSFEYTFVHIGTGHNYRFFSYEERNSTSYFQQKGGNPRGLYLEVNDRLGFLCLSKMSSTFVKIQIDNRSTFLDLSYIVNQVYNFAELSHTSYNKAGKPVTIKYPNTMAGLTEKLKEVNGFDLEEIQTPDSSLWFI